jgi:hypothetical protein
MVNIVGDVCRPFFPRLAIVIAQMDTAGLDPGDKSTGCVGVGS